MMTVTVRSARKEDMQDVVDMIQVFCRVHLGFASRVRRDNCAHVISRTFRIGQVIWQHWLSKAAVLRHRVNVCAERKDPVLILSGGTGERYVRFSSK